MLQPDAGAVGGGVEVLRGLFQPVAFDGAFVRGGAFDGYAEPVAAKFLHAGNAQCVAMRGMVGSRAGGGNESGLWEGWLQGTAGELRFVMLMCHYQGARVGIGLP